MLERKAFLVLSIPNEAWELEDRYMWVLNAHREDEVPKYRIPWPVEMVPDTGEEITFSGILGPCDFIAGKTEYAYSRSSGYISTTIITLAEDNWAAGSLFIEDLQHYAKEGFILGSGTSIIDAFRCAGLNLTPP